MYQPDPPGPTAPAGVHAPVVVLGGGVCGLAAAYALHKRGVPVRLFEAGPRLGGVVRSHNEGGWLSEAGPNSFLENSKRVIDLLEDLGLGSEKLYANASAKKRYLVRGRRALAVPASPGAFFTTPLFSPWAKVRLFGDLLKSPRERAQDVSLADFVSEHFGPEVVKYALNPFVSGVYAGDASLLSAKHSFPSLWRAEATHGSLLRGMGAQAKEKRRKGEPKGRILSFRSGLAALPDALAKTVPAESLRVGAQVTRLVPGVHGAPWKVYWLEDGVENWDYAQTVVSALPAHALAQLEIGPNGARPLHKLGSIRMPPVTSLFLGYRRAQVKHPLDGFGMLIPECEKSPLLGVLFSSTLFPGRAPEGHVALTCMLGGSLHPELAGLPETEQLARIQPELEKLLGVSGHPVLVRRSHWERAIPQYNIGYQEFIDTMETCEHTFPRLLIGGQLRHGISLPQCLEAGLDLADRALR